MATKKTPTTGIEYRITKPWGSASFYKMSELSPRRKQEISIIQMQVGPKLQELVRGGEVTIDGVVIKQPTKKGALPVGLSRTDSRNLHDLNNTVAWALLKSWSLKEAGEPRGLPADPDEFLDDTPTAVYEDISAHAGTIFAEEVKDDFGLDGVEDEDSPTGA